MTVHALGLGGWLFAQLQLLNSQLHEQPLDTSHLGTVDATCPPQDGLAVVRGGACYVGEPA
jgi:hypothetical protein